MIFPRLRDLRKDNDLTQAEMGKYLWVSQRTYSLYETGKREVPLAVFIKLADLYGVSVDYLMGLSDDPTPYPPCKKE